MTIGLIALRAAKEQLAAAIATIKDELKNPELCEQIKYEVFNIGSDLDDHLSELGKAMPALGSAQAAADTQEAQIAEGLTLVDPTQNNGLVEGLRIEPANEAAEPAGSPRSADLDAVAEEQKAADATAPAEHHESLGEKIKEAGKEFVDGLGEAIGEAKFGE